MTKVGSTTIDQSFMMNDIEHEIRDIISDLIFDKSNINYEYGEDLYVKNTDEVADIIIKELKDRGYNFSKEDWRGV